MSNDDKIHEHGSIEVLAEKGNIIAQDLVAFKALFKVVAITFRICLLLFCVGLIIGGFILALIVLLSNLIQYFLQG